MVAHQGVNFFKIHSHPGHSVGTNQERYLERNTLAPTFPGTYSLNGWVDATPKHITQRFIALDLTWQNKLIAR